MKLLLAAATKSEIEPLLSYCTSGLKTIASGDDELTIVITGVGMVATAYSLGRQLAAAKYDLAINAGIAGSFDRAISIGEIVIVKEDHFSELGAENNQEFLIIDELGFGESRMVPLNTIPLHAKMDFSGLKQVKGITVNTVHGNLNSIEAVVNRMEPQIESMEGAAFFYACNQENLPCVQIRSISNYVEPRNPENWNFSLAVKNLNGYLIELFKL